MRSESGEFAKWWWPGQWICIVLSIWFDPLQYWQNIRPLLKGRKRGWDYYIQALLGALLISFVVCAVLSGILALTQVKVQWLSMMLGASVGAISGVLISSLSGLISNTSVGVVRVSYYVIALSFIGLSASVSVNITPLIVVFIFVLGMEWGVITGCDPNVLVSILLATCAIFVGLKSMILILNLITGVLIGLGFYFGNRWTTRQVPDAILRHHLALNKE